MIVAILIAASQISSVDLWSFMRQPENGFTYPSSVSSEHTFGSPDHTNGSRRIVKEDLAAIETLFEAYYERVFFASEGLSNNWDVAEYGPQARYESSLKDVSFAYTNGGDRVWFHYMPETRYMPGTMRFVEVDNLASATFMILQNVFESGDGHAKLLDRGDTWGDGLCRSVWWACSEFDYAEMPEKFDWSSSGWPSGHSFVSNFVPVCAFDGPGHGFPGTFHQDVRHFAMDLLSPVMQRNEDWIAAMGSTDPDYHFVGTNSIFRQLNKVFGCSEDLEYAGFTQRLVPDEYVTMDVGTVHRDLGQYDSPWTDESYAKLMEWKPWIGMPGAPPGVSYGWAELQFGVSAVTGGSVPVEVLASGMYVYEWYDSLRLRLSVPDEVAEQNPSDAVVENYSVADFTCYADDSGAVTNGEWGYVWTSFPLTYRKIDVITNSVTTNVSYLASTARILACHDRTMEVPKVDHYADCLVSNRYDTCRRSSEYFSTDYYAISVDPYSLTFTFDEPVRLSELDYGSGKLYSTNIVAYASPTDQECDCAMLEEPYVTATASFSAVIDTDEFYGDMTAYDIPDNPSYAGTGRAATIVGWYDQSDDTFYYGVMFVDAGGDDVLFWKNGALVWCLSESGIDSLPGTAMFSAYGNASAWRTVHPNQPNVEFRKLFPAYTPGLLGSSRVRSAVCPMVASVVVDYGMYGEGYNVLNPPFTWYDMMYSGSPYHQGRVEYACDMPEFSSWSARSTFPTAYASMRGNVLSRVVGDIIPPSLYDLIPVDKDSYDIQSLGGQCEGGGITYDIWTDPEVGEHDRITVVYDDYGQCIGFRFPDSKDPDFIRNNIFAGIYFTLDARVGEGVDKLFTLPSAKSATGRTSGGIIADWDFHALNLSEENH